VGQGHQVCFDARHSRNPRPPPELSDREQQILDGLRRVAADKSTWPLLKAYCMHAVLAEDLAAELRRHARRAARRR
jgi:hypothetical protein